MSFRFGNPARLRALPRWRERSLVVTLLAVPVVVARADEATAALRNLIIIPVAVVLVAIAVVTVLSGRLSGLAVRPRHLRRGDRGIRGGSRVSGTWPGALEPGNLTTVIARALRRTK